jgi:hypothetical protein
MLNAQVKLFVNSCQLYQSLSIYAFKIFQIMLRPCPNLHPTGCTVVSFLTESIDLVNMGQVV